MSLFSILKYLHILSAIIAVGANATYGIWIARASRSKDTLSFALRTVKIVDDRMANPAYGFLLITGIGMVLTVPYPITTPWILSALVLYAIVFVLGLLAFTPTLRKQIAIAESDGPESAAYQAIAQRSRTLGIAVSLVVLVIVFLMVVKPPLWG